MKWFSDKAFNKIVVMAEKIAAGETNITIESDSKDSEGIISLLKKIAERMAWYEEIIDAVPFPIHVTDGDMNWTYMNKAFEKLMIEQGVIKNRRSGYGKACSHAGANICNTQKCGIKQLQKGVPESYFDWCGMNCKQDTSHLRNAKGEVVGYVEVVTDLSSILSVNEYTKKEVDRLASNLDLLSKGDLNLNMQVAESNQFTEEAREDFIKINNSLEKTKEAIGKLIGDVSMLSDSAIAGKFSVRADAQKHDGQYRKIVEGVNQTLDTVNDRNAWYEAIIDAVPFPIHVTDNDMNWTYMNKSFEKLMIEQGVVRERKDGYGRQCSNAGANICNTQNCGIKQLLKGKAESYFDWCGMSCKQDTSYLRNRKGESIGFVEVVTDLTSILKVNSYTKEEVERLAANLDMLAEGRLDMDLSVKEADQFTKEARENFVKINNSLTKVKSALNLMISDAETLVSSAINGNLESRANASQHNGEYRKIVEGINNTLDAVMEPLNFAAGYIEKMSKGEELEIIENKYKGDFRVLIDNLNKVRASLYTLIDETTMLAKAATEGKISVRSDVNKLKGGYATIVKGVNDTIDAIEIPLTEAKKVLEKISVNDFTTQMTGQYKGTFKEFAEAINQVHTRLISIQDAFERVGKGDSSKLEDFEKIGKRSENDKIMPACIEAMRSIRDLVSEAGILAKAAIDGELDVRGNESKFKGGYKEIIEGMNKTMEAFAEPIQEATSVMQEMAKGNLTVSMTGDYKGEYAKIKNDLNFTLKSFNDVLNDINIAAIQVASGSRQISDSAQALSQGSTEQASSIEELTASMDEIASQTKQNAVNANQANELALSAKQDAVKGNEQMAGMLKAMGDINESSANISKIIKVIDEIAFQTNILALNAAVEAARAGQHGKGFAVVAEEVRNLAARSANAAKETTVLIEGSIKKVEGGTRIANDTAEALNKIVDGVAKAANLVGDIASASNEQASGIAQVNQGIMQVSQVTQTNSATSEESAAASEELSSQAEVLKEMVNKFNLKKTDSSNDLNPEVLKMIENMSTNKKPSAIGGASGIKKISLSNNEFGKY
ncbi:methyl-accepting chemotaxis protein [Pseudobacteroides cellulosolvens]|uniref:Methyl-accepting chemotaxis sensory transducer with Pas/Pac sensor n=1 Tax=Pseudobacteroides cellulosolvens ATCC 35603 = DSM 2933 TaxID=398512 RepID=A0A0L6JIQ2_9FIRM|nr:methyl-accepting chemotaxis protein [Pseudobacteroides cellulosolvens]KNY25716.1 methyl-accepting chemotaxis sensory transducer with Pas/Pac sensor [Pseudobacteroides cellulosolvens ATCC 35603 = DSM 2933]